MDRLHEEFISSCKEGDVSKVKELLRNKEIDINVRNSYGDTPFIWACSVGNMEIVELLVSRKNVDFNAENHEDKTAFYWACINGRVEVVKFLLEIEEVDINKSSVTGWSPFMWACFFGFTEIVQWILASRTDINIHTRNWEGKSALEITKQRVEDEQKVWEDGAAFKKRQADCPKIQALLEHYESEPEILRADLRRKVGLTSKTFFCKL